MCRLKPCSDSTLCCVRFERWDLLLVKAIAVKSVSKRCRALVQNWFTDCPEALDDNLSMLRAIKHCNDFVFAGDLASVTYAEANLPSFSSGENGRMIGMLSNIVSKLACLPHMIPCCISIPCRLDLQKRAGNYKVADLC